MNRRPWLSRRIRSTPAGTRVRSKNESSGYWVVRAYNVEICIVRSSPTAWSTFNRAVLRRYPSRNSIAPSWIRLDALAKKPVLPNRPLISTLLLLNRFAVVAALTGLNRTGHWLTWNAPRRIGFPPTGACAMPTSRSNANGDLAAAVLPLSLTYRACSWKSTTREQAGWLGMEIQKLFIPSSITMKWRWENGYAPWMSWTPVSDRTLKRAPCCAVAPDLVVIWMTPFWARAPYVEDAAAPFTTSMLSMSWGLMSFIEPFITMPSTTISGERLRLIDLAPRRMIEGAVPGRPLGMMTWAPVTFP